jgi:pimeloyl-ACP methyl ester carboxylesterase
MPDAGHRRGTRPGPLDHAASALSAWFGDYLERTDNGLHEPLAFFVGNRPVEPEALPLSERGRVCVLVHGLGCNESLWTFPAPHPPDDYGSLLGRDHGMDALYLRYNTGLRVSANGRALADLLRRYAARHGAALREIALVGHSMGGLVIRSACHVALEKATNVVANVLGLFDTTATRVIRDLLDTRAAGIKDLRYGNLVDEDWLDCDPDALLENRRVSVPWLATARHHRVVGHAAGESAAVGDAVVWPDSAAGRGEGVQPAAPGDRDLRVLAGLDHLALARHPAVYEHIDRVLRGAQAGNDRA